MVPLHAPDRVRAKAVRRRPSVVAAIARQLLDPWQSTSDAPPDAGTPPRLGPREPVRLFGPRIMWFPDTYEAIQYARARGWIGATIVGMRSGAVMGVIVRNRYLQFLQATGLT